MRNLVDKYFGSVFTSENPANESPEVKCFFFKDKSDMLSNIMFKSVDKSKINSKLEVIKAPGVTDLLVCLHTI